MIFLFKKDLWGNKVPCFAAQTSKVATAFAEATDDEVWSFHVKGNKRTIMGL